MTKYFVIEVSFNRNNKWEQIGERFPLMHKAFDEMERMDLSFPTRITKVTRHVVLTELHDKQNTKRKRVAKKKS